MLLTMAPQPATTNTPIFSFDMSHMPSTPARHHSHQPHRPSISSPLSSSPIRASQSSPPHYNGCSSPPLSPRDINTLPRASHRDTQSSPVGQCSFSSIFTPSAQTPINFSNSVDSTSNRFSKYSSRSTKPNPLRQSRETVQDSRRKLFLKNVRQRADDKNWERRGGDQEALRLEWAVLDRKWKQQKDADADGFLYEDDIEDEALLQQQQRQQHQQPQYLPQKAFAGMSGGDSRHFAQPVAAMDEMMADAMALEEQRELDAMVSMYESESQRPASPTLSSDDEYDDLFMDLVSGSDIAMGSSSSSQHDFVCSGEMDMS